MIWHEVNNDIVITLPKHFNMNANLSYLTREKNECMYEIENDIITKVIAIGEIRSLVQVNVINNKQMIVQFLNESRPIEKWKRKGCEGWTINQNGISTTFSNCKSV